MSGKCNVVANNTVIPHLHRLVTDNEYRVSDEIDAGQKKWNVAHLRQFCHKQDLHLGTNAVLSPSKTTYIAIFHGITIKQKRYHNYVYEFAAQPPWRILRVSAKPLELPLGKIVRRGFVFSSSLTRVGDKYVVGYTVNDVSAIFKVFTEAELLADMVEVKE